MDRKINKKITREEHIKMVKRFYKRWLNIFLVTLFLCVCGLGYLWLWLLNYERNSLTGSINAYLKQATKGKYNQIYNQDIDNFIELNSKDAYIEFLKKTYQDYKYSDLTYSLVNAENESRFYDVSASGVKVSTIEVKPKSNNKSFAVRTIFSYLGFSFDMLAKQDKFYINDHEISDENFPPKETVPLAYEKLGLDRKLPKVNRYTVSGIVGNPALTFTNENVIAVKDATTSHYYIGEKPTTQQQTDFEETMKDVAEVYSKYITKDASFYQLSNYLYPNTDFYNIIKGFNNQWFSPHDSVEFENMNMYDIIPIGEQGFIGSISFDYKILAKDANKTYKNAYQVFFVKNSQNKWKLINLVILENRES